MRDGGKPDSGDRGHGAEAEDDPQVRHYQRLEVIGSLAGGVAHEINNPIQSIMNYAQLIRNRTDSPQLGEYADEILDEAQRVAGIIKNLLLFARQEGGPYTEAHIGDLVAQTLSLTAAALRREQIDVRLDVPELPAVHCHPQQIQQVIMNFVTHGRDLLNARYPAGDPAKCLCIRAELLPDAGMVRTTVEDHAGGLPEEEAQRMFDPEWLRLNHGRGLGLSVSYAIVQDHGGRIGLSNHAGQGSLLYFDLPLAE